MAGVIQFLEQIWGVLQGYRPLQDTLDILCVAFIIYSAIKLVRQTRSVQIVKGLALLAVFYAGVLILDMPVMKMVFSTVLTSLVVIGIVLFQPEIRSALEHMGRSSLTGVFGFNFKQNAANRLKQTAHSINAICSACSDMSDEKVGALIVFENRTMLGDIVLTGTVVDAAVSSEMVKNIFFPKSPLHDGAMIVRDGRAYAAGCILPLTANSSLSSKFGTRHRAAIGITEQSDAVVAVVSEETGAISVARKGTLRYDISDGDLRDILTTTFLKPEDEQKTLFARFRKGGDKS